MANPTPYFVVFCMANMMALSNRYASVPIEKSLQKNFDIQETELGSLSSIFYIPFVVATLIFGYLGDRYSRKNIITCCLILEGISMLGTGFASGFYYYSLGRALVGLFQAGFVTIGPVVIADMYNGNDRTIKMTIFAVCGPLGVGISYGLASYLEGVIGWDKVLWGYGTLTLVVGIVFLALVPEYERGQSEGVVSMELKGGNDLTTGLDDSIGGTLRYLLANKTFIWASFAFTFVCCVIESGMVWFSEFLRRKYLVNGSGKPALEDYHKFEFNNKNITIGGSDICSTTCEDGACHLLGTTNIFGSEDSSKTAISCGSAESGQLKLIFGALTTIAGILGPLVGSTITTKFIDKNVHNAGPLVCAVGNLVAGIVTVMLIFIQLGEVGSWILVFFIFTGVCCVFGILYDIIPRVILPDKRAVANSLQNVISRSISGAVPALLTGYLIESVARKETDKWDQDFSEYASGNDSLSQWPASDHYHSDADYMHLRYESAKIGFITVPFYTLLAIICWLVTAKYFISDQSKRERTQGVARL